MKWQQIDEYHWQRACGRYTVSRALMFDRDPRGAWRYTAWRSAARESEAPDQLGACVDDFRSAVALCAADIRQLERRAAA